LGLKDEVNHMKNGKEYLLSFVKKKPCSLYLSKEGIIFKSYSNNWNKNKLVTLYQELLFNKHGKEILSLKEVNIYPDLPLNTELYGLYEAVWSKEKRYLKKGIIHLFNGDNFSTALEYSRILSHEYGHHFTLYYLLTVEGKTFFENGGWEHSGYYSARNFKDFPLVSGNIQNGIEWAVFEIAAEDYVQLFGSPNIYQTEKYYDVLDRMKLKVVNKMVKFEYCNVFPQFNFTLPLAGEIPEIKEYWCKLAGWSIESPQIKNSNIKLLYKKCNKKLIEFKMELNLKDYGEDWNFTLVSYKMGRRYPVKTFRFSENSCYFGSLTNLSQNNTVEDADFFRSGVVIFRIFGVHPDLGIVGSNSLKIDFG